MRPGALGCVEWSPFGPVVALRLVYDRPLLLPLSWACPSVTCQGRAGRVSWCRLVLRGGDTGLLSPTSPLLAPLPLGWKLLTTFHAARSQYTRRLWAVPAGVVLM